MPETTEAVDFHTIEISFYDLAERDQALAEIEKLLAGRGHISHHTWTCLPGEPCNEH